MAIKVKSVTKAADKFVARAAAATGDYKDGVNSTTDQAEAAIAAKAAYEQGVQDAISRGAREAGLRKAGTQKWKTRAVQVGAGRFATGVQAARAEYEDNTKPYLETIAGLTLTPRGPKGSPENYQRSQAVGQALHEKKLSVQTS